MISDKSIEIIESLTKTVEANQKELSRLLKMYESKSNQYDELKLKWDNFLAKIIRDKSDTEKSIKEYKKEHKKELLEIKKRGVLFELVNNTDDF